MNPTASARISPPSLERAVRAGRSVISSADRPHSSSYSVTETSTTRASSNIEPNAMEAEMLHVKAPVNSDTFKVNSERRRLMQRNLRYVTALAAGADTHEDAKTIAAETGIAVSEIYELRAARRNPHLDKWFALMQRRPDLEPQARRIISGEATPDEISKLIAFFQRGSG